MKQLSMLVKMRVIIFVMLAFNAYYYDYFQSFSQGVLEKKSSTIYVIKALSILFFILAFCPKKIKLNIFDFQFIAFSLLVSFSYLVAGFSYNFNDNLFFNFLIFSFLYPVLLYENVEKKIYFSYEIICILIFIQSIGDLIISKFGKMLWDGGLYIGGLGNPTSFAFVAVFCLAFLIFANNGFAKSHKILLGITYIFSIIMSKALFPILLTLFIILVAIIKIESSKSKIIFACSICLVIALFTSLIDFKAGLLGNKLNSFLYFVGLSEEHNESLSVSLRAQNINMAVNFICDISAEWFFGHYQGSAYYPVDSQYITILMSFGFIVFLYFIVFNLVAFIKIFNNKKMDNSAFIFIGLLLCNFMFINNRILDYFPLSFIYVTLITLISKNRPRHLIRPSLGSGN